MRPLLLAVLLAGCTNQTGIELSVGAAASPTSIEAGVVAVEFLVSNQSYCERWVIDSGIGTGTRADVRSRDLHAKPYQLLVHPTHFTDLSRPVFALAVALDADGKPIGVANFGAHRFAKGRVDEYKAEVELFQRTDASYVADGCACVPGLPWVGNGSGTGCDLNVVPSFQRFQDTAGCELSPGRRELAGPVCDGHQYLTEVTDRRMPCFATGAAGCQVGLRTCADHDGFAWDAECVPVSGDPALPTGALCDAYASCEQETCGDLVGCFEGKVAAAHNLQCTLHVDPTALKPCSDGKWETVIPVSANATGAACVASLVEGRIQPPFTVGFKDASPTATGTRTRSTLCPPTLIVESIATDPALPSEVKLVLTIGDQLVNVNLTIVRSCELVTSSLNCG